MKIYLAGGMPLMNAPNGKERKLCDKMPEWKRLFSFYFKEYIFNANILTLVQQNKNK